eukprot:m.158351 g.158351  ORF g.158351 m.158351 type:complete len:248 (+) comp10246_c0_seq3:1502-2245(+)
MGNNEVAGTLVQMLKAELPPQVLEGFCAAKAPPSPSKRVVDVIAVDPNGEPILTRAAATERSSHQVQVAAVSADVSAPPKAFTQQQQPVVSANQPAVALAEWACSALSGVSNPIRALPRDAAMLSLPGRYRCQIVLWLASGDGVLLWTEISRAMQRRELSGCNAVALAAESTDAAEVRSRLSGMLPATTVETLRPDTALILLFCDWRSTMEASSTVWACCRSMGHSDLHGVVLAAEHALRLPIDVAA